MNLWEFFFNRRKNDSPDVLGRYPEHMQIQALPERRYLKTSRLLALLIFLNLAAMMVFAGFFTYYADRVDLSIANRRAVNLYSIDSSRQVLVPTEYSVKRVSAINLFVESILRKYIQQRHEILWENSVMQSRWNVGGLVHIFSNHKKVYMPFRLMADHQFSESRAKGFVRDVHLYELKHIKENFWEAVFDTFDMPVPDAYAPICNCSNNSKSCIDCKIKNTYRRLRYRVYIRTGFANAKTKSNPLGVSIELYNMLYEPIHTDEIFWRVPNALKPEL